MGYIVQCNSKIYAGLAVTINVYEFICKTRLLNLCPEVKIKLQMHTLISKVHFAKQIDVIIKKILTEAKNQCNQNTRTICQIAHLLVNQRFVMKIISHI